MTSTGERILSALRDDGFAVIRGLVSPGDLRLLSAAYDEAFERGTPPDLRLLSAAYDEAFEHGLGSARRIARS